jgi:hypothetical protein
VSSPIWGSCPDIYYCFTVTVLFLWGALSDERTFLSFVYAAGPCQRSHSYVPVPWDSRPYCTVADSRLRRLLRLAGSQWRYSTPPPHGLLTFCICPLLITSQHVPCRNTPFPLLQSHSCIINNLFTCLLSRCPETPISRSLHSNGSTRHNTVSIFTPTQHYGVKIKFLFQKDVLTLTQTVSILFVGFIEFTE